MSGNRATRPNIQRARRGRAALRSRAAVAVTAPRGRFIWRRLLGLRSSGLRVLEAAAETSQNVCVPGDAVRLRIDLLALRLAAAAAPRCGLPGVSARARTGRVAQ